MTARDPAAPAPWWRRPLRLAGIAAAAWFGVFLAAQAALLLAGVFARAAGHDPRLHDDGWPGIPNLRMVDDHVLVGGQPSLDEYRALAAKGITLVIDMRHGHNRSDGDEEAALASLGVRYATVSIIDGRAPTPTQTRRFLDLVESNEGRVFAHCGGGVGRSTTVAATYQAFKGQNPSVLEQLATGPPTLEQIWYVATIEPGKPAHGTNPVLAVISRAVDMPRTIFNHLTSMLFGVGPRRRPFRSRPAVG